MEATRSSEGRVRAAVVPFPRGTSVPRLRPQALAPSARSLAVGLVLVALAAGAYAAARLTPAFAVNAVAVEGAPPALAREVERALAPLAGRSLVALEPDDVVPRVERVPGVLAAGYDRAFPHTLVVLVRPERPAAVVRRGRESWLVSARGRVLRALPPGTLPRLARVWVPRAAAVSFGATLADPAARRGVRVLASAAREGFEPRVAAVRARGGELTLVLGSRLEVRLGDARRIPLKLAVANAIVPTLSRPSAGGPTYLDVSLPERPVAGKSLKSQP